MPKNDQTENGSPLTIRAPAKINLFLKILSRRQDGLHEIVSLMQKVSLCDILHLQRLDGQIELSCPGASLPEDEGNLAYRAAKAFFAATGTSPGARIVLEKKIPVAAGLGGGSSDAAAVIRGLDRLLSLDLSREQLLEIGRPLGADVAFFIEKYSAGLATGIGDRIAEKESLGEVFVVLVNPGFPVSTKWVYENFPLTSISNPYILARCLEEGSEFQAAGHRLCDEFGNDLEAVTIGRYPEIKNIKDDLEEAGAAAALMSGSGPTVFGLFFSEEDAQRSIMRLGEKYGENVFLTRPYIP